MKIYTIEGKKYVIFGNELYAIGLAIASDSLDGSIAVHMAPPPETVTRGKTKKHRKSTLRHCANCGEAGHIWKTCQKPKKTEDAPPSNPDEIRDQVHELQREGMTSVKIAQKLKISIRHVNLYWDTNIDPPEPKDDGLI